MALHPHIQKRAQAEVDHVLGSGTSPAPERLPTPADQERLPYVEALCKEVLRWQPATPLGMPHIASADDVLDGKWIPKGAMVIANSWCE